MEEIEALLVLLNTPRLGPVRINLLIKHFGSAKKVLTANKLELEQIPKLDKQVIHNILCWKTLSTWKDDLYLINKHQVKLLPYFSAEYPNNLKELNPFPPLLYLKGKNFIQTAKPLAIIGTRRCTQYGIEMGETLSKELALSAFTIISGLARGIDTSAHVGALRGGVTFAVLGSGIDKIYPRENLALAEKICTQGGLISQFPMSTPPEKGNFPKRNQVVAALSDSLLLIEAPVKSGAMITMQVGYDLKKTLYCLPGRVDYQTFSGNHYLIKKKGARLVEKAQDLLDSSSASSEDKGFRLKTQVNTYKLDIQEASFLKDFPPGECHAEELLQNNKLSPGKLNAILMGLVLKGLIREYPGKFYKKIG